MAALALESNHYVVDEGASAVQVCMHLGGKDLVDNVTLFTLDGSARGKRNLVTIFESINLIILIWFIVAEGRDYSRTVRNFTVKSGERKCITIRILNDAIVESTMEYFRIRLISTEFPRSRYATVYIQDNDGKDMCYLIDRFFLLQL